MTLSLQDHTGATICTLDDNDAMLGAYPLEDFLTLWCQDGNPHGATADQFENLALVEKQEMAEEEYAKMTNSVRAFKERNKMGRFNPEFQAKQEAAAAAKETEGEAEAATMKAGDRCEVAKGGK